VIMTGVVFVSFVPSDIPTWQVLALIAPIVLSVISVIIVLWADRRILTRWESQKRLRDLLLTSTASMMMFTNAMFIARKKT
jgi:hypothetical protein